MGFARETCVSSGPRNSRCWELAQSEVAKGWVGTPQVVDIDGLLNVIMSPRFCILEQHGTQAPKFRSVECLAKSRANLLTELVDTYRPQRHDYLLALCRLLAKHGAEGLEMWSLDFPNACKAIPVRPRSDDVANVVFANPGDGKAYRARVLVRPFGSCSAPENWGRLITCVQELAMRLFRLHLGAYVDDVFTGEPSTYALSGFVAFKKIARLLGLPTADREDQRPAETIRVLGAVATVSSNSLTVCADEKRKYDNVEPTDEASASGMLTPAGAGKIRGELGFLASLSFGEVGWSLLAPLAKRQYAVGTRALTFERRTCLERRRRQLPDLAPMFAPYDFRFVSERILTRRAAATPRQRSGEMG